MPHTISHRIMTVGDYLQHQSAYFKFFGNGDIDLKLHHNFVITGKTWKRKIIRTLQSVSLHQ